MRLYGSNASIDRRLFDEAAPNRHARCAWLASGRDALALAARVTAVTQWLVPEFICGVVPATLRATGAAVHPYAVGALSDVGARGTDVREYGVLLLWDLGIPPPLADWDAARSARVIVEDRCLWVGLPAEVTAPTWAIGSLRKWYGGAPCGWLVAPVILPEVQGAPPAAHARLSLAAASVRSAREVALTTDLQDVNIALNDASERSLGVPSEARPASRSAILFAEQAEPDRERDARAHAARALCRALEIDEPPAGCTGIRIRSPERDGIRDALRSLGVHATVHWADGDWAGRVPAMTSETLTIPLPPVDAAGAAELADAVTAALKHRVWAHAPLDLCTR